MVEVLPIPEVDSGAILDRGTKVEGDTKVAATLMVAEISEEAVAGEAAHLAVVEAAESVAAMVELVIETVIVVAVSSAVRV